MTEEPGTTSEPPEGGETPDHDEGGLSRRKFIGSVAAAGIGGLTLAGVLAACGGSSTEETTAATTAAATTEAATTSAAGQTTANNSKPFLIGSPYPISGTAAADGEQMKGGSGLAIQQINDARRGRRPDDRAGDRRHRHLHAGGRDHGVEQARGDGARRNLHRVPHRLAAGVRHRPAVRLPVPQRIDVRGAGRDHAEGSREVLDDVPDRSARDLLRDRHRPVPEQPRGERGLEAEREVDLHPRGRQRLQPGDLGGGEGRDRQGRDVGAGRGRAGGHGNDRLGPADLEGRVGEPRCRHEHALGAGRARGIHEAVGAESDELARVPPVRRIGAAVRSKSRARRRTG